MKASSILLAVLASALFLTGCSKDNKDDQTKLGLEGERAFLTETQRNTIKVTDLAGNAIVGAEVLIGNAVNDPFADNFVQTNAAGTFTAPTGWTTEQVITISAKGYIRASYFGQIPNGQSFQLRLAPVAAPLELRGKGTGFTLKDGDNVMDFALVMPAVKKRDMLAFNIDMFISPQTDQITVYGNKLNLPSNTSIPKQKENYGMFPVTIDKSLYRLYFDQPANQKIVTIHGQFPFKQVVGELQGGKTFIDVINQFTLKGGSLRNVSVVLPAQTLDVPIGELVFNQPRSFKAPNFAADEFLMAASLTPYADEFYPTDFKNVPPNAAFNLMTGAGSASSLVVALKKKAEQEMVSGKLSAAFIPFDVGAQPTLLPLIASPQVISANEFKVTLPAIPQGFNEVGAYMTFSTVVKTGTGKETKEKVTHLWDVYADSWMNHVSLPKWPGDVVPAGTKRWDVLLMANQAPAPHNPVALTARVFETVTHATHSATDF
jgi:hypothetical protein